MRRISLVGVLLAAACTAGARPDATTMVATPSDTARPPILAATSVDTARPPIPPYGYPADTTLLTVAPDDTSYVYLRTLLGVGFDDSTSGVGVRRALASVGGRIVGGLPGFDMYVIAMPDPGPNMDALTGRRLTLQAQPGVNGVKLMYYRSGPRLRDAREH